MNNVSRTFSLLPEPFAVCRLAPDALIPDWAMPRQARFFAVTQTREELSLICPQANVPTDAAEVAEIIIDPGWHCLKLEGPFGLDEPGILASIVTPLAQAGISVFAEATYDTDYLLVKHIDRTLATLVQLDHRILK